MKNQNNPIPTDLKSQIKRHIEVYGHISLINELQNNIEWLETTQGDEVECIGIENLEGILSRVLKRKIKLSIG